MKETEAAILFNIEPRCLEIKETDNQYFKKSKLTTSVFLFCFTEFAQYHIPNVSKIAQAAFTSQSKFVAGPIFSHLFFVSPN